MKNIWILLIVVIVLGGAYLYFQPDIRYYVFHQGMPPGYCDPGPCPGTSSNPKTYTNPQLGRDLAVQDLAAYFNSKLSCGGGKMQTGSQPCFNSNFRAIDPVGGIYENPIYQLVDFTGDGKLDALVTIYYSGSGSQRDFYALAIDPALTGDNKITTITYLEGAGVSRSATPPYFANGSIILNAPGSVSATTLVWDKQSHNFVNAHGKPKELPQ